MSYDSTIETRKHINRVSAILDHVINRLTVRGNQHDYSKIHCAEEKDIFDEFTPKLKDCTYGSDEYKSYLAAMKPALDHHYAHKYNRHHPEHFENGIDGMTLIDIVEMLCDWKAASERHADGDIFKSIEINRKRFNLSDQMYSILVNTAKELFGD